jgi:hypothetical protein
MERMYRAGKDYIPKSAERLRSTSKKFHDLLVTFDKQSALAGDPTVLRNMLMVGGDTYDVLRGGVENLYHCAEAVVKTADDFRETDAGARDDFARMDRRVRDLPTPTEKPAPPSLGDPEDPGSGDTPSTPDPQNPDDERHDRDHKDDDPTAWWGV